MSKQTRAIELTLLSARSPTELKAALIDPTVPPSPGTGGYSMGGGQSALIGMSVRTNDPGRTTTIKVTSVDLAATYTLTIDGNANAYNATSGAPADLPELLTQWKASIDGDAAISPLVSVTSDGIDTLTIVQSSVVGVSVLLTQSGTATLDLTLEYEAGNARLYGRSSVNVILSSPDAAKAAVEGWKSIPISGSSSFTFADGQGYLEGASVGSIDAIGFFIDGLSGVSGDQSIGTVSGVTTAFATPTAWAAPGVVGVA